jgi:signal transduction histidine kinase
MIEVEVDDESIKMGSELESGLPKVWIDSDQIRQVLLNMLRNAVHAMPDGGKIWVRTKREDGYVNIEVQDTGMGISEDNIQKLLTAFFTTKSSGSGLGLTICSQIIHNHGGSIGVRSKVGEGTTFVVSLPLRRGPAVES